MADLEWKVPTDAHPLPCATVAIFVRMDGGFDFRTGFMNEHGEWFMHPAERLEPVEVAYWARLHYPPNPDARNGAHAH